MSESDKSSPSPIDSAYVSADVSPSPSEHGGKTPSESTFPLPPPTVLPEKVLAQDSKTPDSWLPRDERLIRLTGTHPFNVEPPLSALYDEGFLTSPELFYVRNHGAVPRLPDGSDPLDWEFSVEGMVAEPFTMTLRDILNDYEQETYPVTLVCAGNRRKEQNMVRKSKGFSWGAAGVSTALFTGVSLPHILNKAKPLRGAKYMCMEGADKLPNGYYGTSVKLSWARDLSKGMMLAHGMNGEPLRPDHGYPLRVVIPGQIGGRSVKWLKKIIVTAEPSDNWYHFWDNRVLPTMVSPEESANDDSWWKDERYAIYDLNTNSAVCYPAHDEKVSAEQESYTIRGYAYGGGGRRVTRMEVSLDQGVSWKLANMKYPEDAYREAAAQRLCGGTLDMADRDTSFCWSFWSLALSVSDLADSKDILVRGMDESMNLQPRDMYWSVLGMMNNPWFRVCIHKEDDGKTLRFEHPTQPALMPGGWMERVKTEGGDLSDGYWGERFSGVDAPVKQVPAAPKEEVKMTVDSISDNIISLATFLEHKDSETAPWFVVNSQVYDGTPFLDGHPGGAQSIVSAAGTDCSDEFLAIHSETARKTMPDYHIGRLSDADLETLLASSSSADADAVTAVTTSPTFLNPKAWLKATLLSKRKISPDTKLFTLSLGHEAQTLGLPIGQHLLMRLTDPASREHIIRAYTPISPPTLAGTVEILVKLYGARPPEFAGGKMSMALDAIPCGHSIELKGPTGAFEYLGGGNVHFKGVTRNVSRFVMLCAGSGVTPIWQVLAACASELDVAIDAAAKKNTPKCVIVDANRAEQDILLREQMDEMVGRHDNLSIMHTLSSPDEAWQGNKGRVSTALMESFIGRKTAEGEMALVCGPPAFEELCLKELDKLGFGQGDIVIF